MRIKLRPENQYEPAANHAKGILCYSFIVVIEFVLCFLIVQFLLLIDLELMQLESSYLQEFYHNYSEAIFIFSAINLVLLIFAHFMLFVRFLYWLNRVIRNTLILSGKENRFLPFWGYQMTGTPMFNNLVAWFCFREVCRHFFLDSTGPEQREAILRFFKRRCWILIASTIFLFASILFGLLDVDQNPELIRKKMSVMTGSMATLTLIMAYCWNSMITKVNELDREKYEDYLRHSEATCTACGEPVTLDEECCPVCGAPRSIRNMSSNGSG
ncbi:MAG: hypothetical protein KDA65_09770 [Planctomycetaceae bacterium]|nr:hypothetical protein [Planctomycetaceae bacterium]